MKSQHRVLSILLATAGAASSLPAAAADTPASPAAVTAAGGWVATHTKAHAIAYTVATETGAMDESEPVHIAVALKLRNQAELDRLTEALASGQSTRTLSSADFLARHAPTREQATRVSDYLRSLGFQNIEVADNRLLVVADGTPSRILRAFQADLRHFDVGGRRAYANVTDANVPAALADSVLAVTGLQTVTQAHTYAIRAGTQPRAASSSSSASSSSASSSSASADLAAGSDLTAPAAATPEAATPAAVTGVDPIRFPGLYGASGMASAFTGTIGIITAGKMTQTVADLQTFAANAGYPAPPVQVVTLGSASSDTSGVDEWNLDTQSSLAAAGGTVKSILLYTANSLSDANLTTAYNKAVSDNLARVINVSLGECETSAKSSGVEKTDDQIFQAAVSQGQTFSVSSGDSGSYECGGSTNEQSYPAASPYVMAIGGTTLSSSGSSYLSETAWSCSSSSTCPQSKSGGTGGGVSTTESAPSWQTSAGVLTTAGKRGVPDIAFDASPNSGALILINGSKVQIGGTSLSAPLFTGFYTRIQAAHGNALGFPASKLYSGAAGNPSWFHDVTSGSNGGYSAKTGWDYVTGFGSLQVQNFSSAF